MQSVLLSLLPSVLVLIFSTLPGKYEVLALPISIPKPPPGSKVVIVVGGNGGNDGSVIHGPPPTMVTGESQISEVKTMILHPSSSSLQQIKRQGHLSKQGLQTSSLHPIPEFANKKEKSFLEKMIPSSPRHISGVPSDIFHHRKPPMSNEQRTGPGPRIMDFRPHQPDITSDMQKNNGKLSLPVLGFADENNLGAGLGTPSPTPMANKLNPYTNGVASSFPPGIDPYEGFIRYAAENLDTPMGNMVDYHSLEHYYGPQHPLSPYHNSKEAQSLQSSPYADSFAYGGNSNGIETGNSPPPPPPPRPGRGPGGPPPPGFGEEPDINDGGPGPGPDDHPPHHHGGGGGFRPRDNPMGGRPGGPRGRGHNSMSSPPPSYEHGIDHFHAPSPGLGSAPPRPRPPTSDPSLYEEEHGYHSPPFEPPPHGEPPYTQNHHAPPFKHTTSAAAGEENSLYDDERRQHNGSPPPQHTHVPDPPDLDVFEEGPPPPGSQPPVPPPPHHQPQNNPQNEAENNDGGDDAIWGILDLAEMLEKGQLPGQGTKNAASAATPGGGRSQALPGVSGQTAIPTYHRPQPPRSFYASNSPYDGPPTDDDDEGGGEHPPHIPPPIPAALQSNNHKGGFPGGGDQNQGQGASDDGGFDYDDQGANNSRPGSYGGPADSQEANDYGDDLYSK